LARDLINEPPSRMNPERLSEEALKMNRTPLSVSVYEKKDLEKMGTKAGRYAKLLGGIALG